MVTTRLVKRWNYCSFLSANPSGKQMDDARSNHDGQGKRAEDYGERNRLEVRLRHHPYGRSERNASEVPI
jgi:hypothetical protein